MNRHGIEHMQELIFSPSDFVGAVNQTLEYAYPTAAIVGELANLRVSKNKWVYFDLKDEFASVKFFGMAHQLPGPLEDGLMVQVQGSPRLHPLYGFSVNVLNIRAIGEGSIKRAASLLEAKLRAEGLFDEVRKRQLPYPPTRIGLITSGESAAFADFTKILNQRWSGVKLELCDVQVQGQPAPLQIIKAIEYFNSQIEPVEVLVIIRGGGSAEDLAAFSTEQVTRSVASSHIPTLVAVGHEIDVSLAELAADKQASTPSNAAELLVPDKTDVLLKLRLSRIDIIRILADKINQQKRVCKEVLEQLKDLVGIKLDEHKSLLLHKKQLLIAMDPGMSLKRGFVIVRSQGKPVRSGSQLKKGQGMDVEFYDSFVAVDVKDVKLKKANEQIT